MRAWPVVLALLLIAGFTVASTPAEHVDIEASRCMDCHAEGKWSPAMEGARISQMRFLQEGDAWFLEADVENQWLDEYQRVAGVVTAAQAIKPAAMDPVVEAFDVAMPAGVQEQVAFIEYDVPAGATTLGFTMSGGATLPASFKVEIIAPGQDASTRTDYDAADIATAGREGWMIKVTRTGASEATTVKVTATAGTGDLLAFAAPAEPGNKTTLRWAIEATNGTASGMLTVYYDSYYDHLPPTDELEDLDHILVTLPFEVRVDNGTPSFAVDPTRVDSPDAESPGLGFAAIVGLLGIAALRRR